MTPEVRARIRALSPPRSGTDGRGFTDDELEFLMAMDLWKRHHRRPFPAWHEVLGVLLALGYTKER